MFEVRLDKILSMYPTKEEITVNKIKSSTSYYVDFRDSSKNKVKNIRYFYNKNNDMTAKIVNDNDNETIITYCYEDETLKLVYKNGLLWKEYTSANEYTLYTENASYKMNGERVREVYDKSGLSDIIAYVINDNYKVIQESGAHYTTEYLYDKNDKLKRIIYTVDDKLVRDILIVYRKNGYELENLLTRSVTYVKINKLGFPSKITVYDKNNIKIGCTDLQYTLEDDTVI